MFVKNVTMNLRRWSIEARKLSALNAKAGNSLRNCRSLQFRQSRRPRAPLIQPVRRPAAAVETRVAPAHAPCPISTKCKGLQLKLEWQTKGPFRLLGTLGTPNV
jgi:hypothetical protein